MMRETEQERLKVGVELPYSSQITITILFALSYSIKIS